ncbi:MAG: SRPBCC family protein [Dysgonamonadaceae bacterium]|nr:SRPBCC family protein [Dysgonamonadaceae bacterium]
MTDFASKVKSIPHNSSDIFAVLSDFSKLELIKDRLPDDKISDFTFDHDHCSFNVNPFGEVSFAVIEREPNKLVKFKSENMPFEVFLWIQLVEKAEKDTKLKITVRADLNPFLKSMMQKPLSDAVDKISDVLTKIPYNEIA